MNSLWSHTIRFIPPVLLVSLKMVRVRKIALLGFPAVGKLGVFYFLPTGKSSLAHQFVNRTFQETYNTTIENRIYFLEGVLTLRFGYKCKSFWSGLWGPSLRHNGSGDWFSVFSDMLEWATEPSRRLSAHGWICFGVFRHKSPQVLYALLDLTISFEVVEGLYHKIRDSGNKFVVSFSPLKRQATDRYRWQQDRSWSQSVRFASFMSHFRTVTEVEADTFAKEHGIQHIESSAKDNLVSFFDWIIIIYYLLFWY